MMPRMTVLFLLATVGAVAQVVAHEETNLVTLVKTVTLTVPGDKSFSPQGTPALFGIRCEEGKKGSKVYWVLATGVVTVPMRNLSKPQLFGRDIRMVETQARFDDETRSGPLLWQQTEDPAFLIMPLPSDFRRRMNKFFQAKLLHIEVHGFQTGSRVSSFNLTGLWEEYDKHPSCPQ
jgi:hypothetical protein